MSLIILWITVIFFTFAWAYASRLAEATLSFGKSVSDSDSATGLQDAVTPRWVTNFSLFTYIGCLCAIIAMGWFFSWKLVLAAIATIFFGGMIVRQLLPKPDSVFFVKMISRSLMNRYADFIKNNDSVRANAIKNILSKIGIHPDQV